MGVTIEAEPLSRDWVDELVQAADGVVLAESSPSPATVAFTIGKTRRAVLIIDGGRIVSGRSAPPGEDASGDEADLVSVTVPTTAKQLAALLDGSESMAQAYMRGDLKPEGPTGAFLDLIEIVELLAAR